MSSAIDGRFKTSKSKVIAINNNGSSLYNYSKKVRFQIDQTELDSYLDAAAFINGSKIKIVNIQHEFGIFGGKKGDYIIPFLKALKKPVVTTFHSVLGKPDDHRKDIVREISKYSKKIVVTIDKAKQILHKEYGVNKKKIVVIPHGIHPVDFVVPSKTERLFGKNRIVMTSFGLINQTKNLECAIDALPDIVKKYPNFLYVIIGETHPGVRLKEGEHYRNKLIKRVKKLGLKKNVKFYNKYLGLNEVIKCLQSTDIYITPYRSKEQVSSGTLAYAFGCGRVCISTPYYFADDLLSNGRGVLVKFNDSGSIVKNIFNILKNPNLKKSIEKKAYSYSRSMTWPVVAKGYLDVFKQVVKNHPS